MKAGLLFGTVTALLLGCASAAVGRAVPDDLLELYDRARTYRMVASSRICADPALRPRHEAAASRLEVARRALSVRYVDPRLDREPPPPFADRSTLCTNAAAAATAVSGFEAAVAGLEARLH
ncbi:MAG TPA: hypothetical protein VEW25_06135 [Allosphingosinicella sp.]|nr:hypothetical protein [Allosphingosinicella sp.]